VGVTVPLGSGVGVVVADGVGLAEAGVGVSARGVAVSVTVQVGSGVSVGVAVMVALGVAVIVGEAAGVAVSVAVGGSGVSVCVAVGGSGVLVSVAVGGSGVFVAGKGVLLGSSAVLVAAGRLVGDGCGVFVGDGRGVSVGGAMYDCGVAEGDMGGGGGAGVSLGRGVSVGPAGVSLGSMVIVANWSRPAGVLVGSSRASGVLVSDMLTVRLGNEVGVAVMKPVMITFWLDLGVSSSHNPISRSSSTARAASIYCQRSRPVPTVALDCTTGYSLDCAIGYPLDCGGLPKPLCSGTS
jgi:hypothetical protein